MTVPRPQRKLSPKRLPLALLIAVMASAPIVSPRAATTERVVADRHSGLAINGFDPVAYFVDQTAVVGVETLEYPFAGAVWRFRNDGNRAAFMATPEVYMPRFGGYDPVGVARGAPVAGDPRLWLIVGERLYLFFSRDAREAFADDAERILAAADRRWPDVRLTLSP